MVDKLCNWDLYVLTFLVTYQLTYIQILIYLQWADINVSSSSYGCMSLKRRHHFRYQDKFQYFYVLFCRTAVFSCETDNNGRSGADTDFFIFTFTRIDFNLIKLMVSSHSSPEPAESFSNVWSLLPLKKFTTRNVTWFWLNNWGNSLWHEFSTLKSNRSTENKVKRGMVFQICPAANTKCKALSSVFMKRCSGAFSFLRWRRIINAKMKNNQLSNYSLWVETWAELITDTS